jgi:hypothetical protein
MEGFRENTDSPKKSSQEPSKDTCFCNNCGNRLAFDIKFCPKCGQKNSLYAEGDEENVDNNEDCDDQNYNSKLNTETSSLLPYEINSVNFFYGTYENLFEFIFKEICNIITEKDIKKYKLDIQPVKTDSYTQIVIFSKLDEAAIDFRRFGSKEQCPIVQLMRCRIDGPENYPGIMHLELKLLSIFLGNDNRGKIVNVKDEFKLMEKWETILTRVISEKNNTILLGRSKFEISIRAKPDDWNNFIQDGIKTITRQEIQDLNLNISCNENDSWSINFFVDSEYYNLNETIIKNNEVNLAFYSPVDEYMEHYFSLLTYYLCIGPDGLIEISDAYQNIINRLFSLC